MKKRIYVLKTAYVHLMLQRNNTVTMLRSSDEGTGKVDLTIDHSQIL